MLTHVEIVAETERDAIGIVFSRYFTRLRARAGRQLVGVVGGTKQVVVVDDLFGDEQMFFFVFIRLGRHRDIAQGSAGSGHAQGLATEGSCHHRHVSRLLKLFS